MYSRQDASRSAKSTHVPEFDPITSDGVRRRWLRSKEAGGGLMYSSLNSCTSADQMAWTCRSTSSDGFSVIVLLTGHAFVGYWRNPKDHVNPRRLFGEQRGVEIDGR